MNWADWLLSLKIKTAQFGRFCMALILKCNVVCRIDRFAVLAHFKMQLRAAGVCITHVCDGLAAFDLLSFIDQQALVVAVCAQIR